MIEAATPDRRAEVLASRSSATDESLTHVAHIVAASSEAGVVRSRPTTTLDERLLPSVHAATIRTGAA